MKIENFENTYKNIISSENWNKLQNLFEQSECIFLISTETTKSIINLWKSEINRLLFHVKKIRIIDKYTNLDKEISYLNKKNYFIIKFLYNIENLNLSKKLLNEDTMTIITNKDCGIENQILIDNKFYYNIQNCLVSNLCDYYINLDSKRWLKILDEVKTEKELDEICNKGCHLCDYGNLDHSFCPSFQKYTI